LRALPTGLRHLKYARARNTFWSSRSSYGNDAAKALLSEGGARWRSFFFSISQGGRRSHSAWFNKKSMKTKLLQICAVLLTLGILLANGCATSGGGEYTLKQTSFDVETAMQAYRNASTAGSLTLAEQQNVNAAYSAYKPAFDQAVAQAKGDLTTASPANVKQLANNLLSIINAIPQ